MPRPVVFVAWDSELKAVQQTFTGIARRPDAVDLELLGGVGDAAVGVLSRRLDDAVQRGAAVLAIVDQPNANMAWELGMALARGRPFALATEAAAVGPCWLDDTPLRGVLRQPDVCEHARHLLTLLHQFAAPPPPPTPGDRKLLLCPDRGTGRELHRALHQELVPQGWELLDPWDWTLDGLSTLLDEVGRLGWVQLRTRAGEARHGVDNTLGALLAGYAHALGVPVAAFVDEHCPRPLDAHELERRHAGEAEDLVHAVRAWSAELDQPAPVRARALLDRYRAAVQQRHAWPLAYVRALGLDVAELQPVDLDVVVGDEIDGLDAGQGCRRPLEQARHGTLDRLLAEDLDGQGPVRWLLQAEPGAGKTTLLRRLAHQLAGEDRLPVLLSLARWEGRGDPVEVAAAVELGAEDEARRVAAALRRAAAERGRTWLLLDGYDEVQDHDGVREQIHALATDPAWAHAAIVVTSRPAAVQGGTAWKGWTRASLRLLDDARQQQLVAGLLRAHPDRAGAFWREVGARPGVAALLPNPFLLTLTVGLFLKGLDSGQATPPNRLRLLQRAVEDCLKRGWSREPVPRPARWSPRGARRLLRGLSLQLHRQGGEAWTRDQLSDAIFELPEQVPTLCKVYGRDRQWESDEVFLDDVQHHAGLLGPLDGAGLPWRYLHRSLRELLAAECLAQELPAARRAELLAELAAEGEGAVRSAEVVALLAGLVPEEEALGHLGALCKAAPDAGIRALASAEGLPPARWLGLLLDMAPKQQAATYWWPRWNNDDLDAVLDAIGRDGADSVGQLWEAVHPDLPAPRLGVLWYALERLDPAASPGDFLLRCGKADLDRPILPTCAIPAGSFGMGEGPTRTVTLTRPYDLGRTPVTLAQYRAFDTAHVQDPWTDPAMPAVLVDWFTARLYAAWLGGRLPTEAEWEHACRAGTTTVYWSGDSEADLARVGWYKGNSGKKLHAVGEKPANPWGLVDMHGNCWEWCADRAADLQGAVDPAGPPRGAIRVLRGGSWWFDPVWCRSAARDGLHPGDRLVDFGFRVVLPARSPAGS